MKLRSQLFGVSIVKEHFKKAVNLESKILVGLTGVRLRHVKPHLGLCLLFTWVHTVSLYVDIDYSVGRDPGVVFIAHVPRNDLLERILL